MEEILGTTDIRKFLEYVKQLEEFMGTMPQASSPVLFTLILAGLFCIDSSAIPVTSRSC